MIIFHNAKIYAPERLTATALAIDFGQVIAQGSDDDILNGFSDSVARINLEGKTLWPGLTDSHFHIQHLAEAATMIDCETETVDECLNRVRQAARNKPKSTWVRGHGWNQNSWDGGFGNAKILDSVSEGHPVFLTAKSLHAAWANSRALELAGIDRHTQDPPDGAIQRDDQGDPTGILFENSATQMVQKIIPQPDISELSSAFSDLFPKLWSVGLIGGHDFDGIDCWKALQNIYQRGNLNFRIRKHIPFDHLDAFIQAGLRTNSGDERLNIGCVKLFADGALGPQTAAMFTPYEGTTDQGILLLTEKAILEIGTHAVSNGIGLSIHAIGDRAIHTVLNAFEKLRVYEQEHNLPHLQHRIEHVQTIASEDIPRLVELDIIASVQPVHAPSDMETADQFLGDRAKNTYMFRSFLQAGANLIFGSDAPVESHNPFYGIHAAVTRRRLNGDPGKEGWHPEQRLTLPEALKGFTSAPYETIGQDFKCGKIKTGYHADFLILTSDPFMLDTHQLGSIRPEATFIDGTCLYQSASSVLDLQIR